MSVRLTRAGIPHVIWGGEWRGPAEILETERGKGLFGDRSHAWIEFPQYDDAILDVTADQFSEHPDIKSIMFPAPRYWYQRLEFYDVDEIYGEAQRQGIEKPEERAIIPLAGPLFRRPLKRAKVRVRNHLRHPPRSCLCNRSKRVDRVRRGMVRRLK